MQRILVVEDDWELNRVLILEGLLFAGASLILTATAGLGITYVLYQTLNYQQIAFSRGTIVERIRGFE